MLKRRGFALPTLLILAVPVAALTLAATALMISSQCSTSAPTATPTSTASKAIPPQLLTIYEQVGSQYNLPWQILAGIGQEECDQGRDPDPSCTPQPEPPVPALRTSPARPDRCRSGLAVPPATSTTPCAATSPTRRWDRTCGPTTNTPIVAGEKAKILAGGDAAAPQQAPVAVRAMIAAGNRINHFDYQWGGGHANPSLSDNQTNPQPQGGERPGDNGTPGYDWSGATDYVLYGGGLGNLIGNSDPASGALEGAGDPGPGKWVTIYANGDHAYIQVAGIYLDTAAG